MNRLNVKLTRNTLFIISLCYATFIALISILGDGLSALKEVNWKVALWIILILTLIYIIVKYFINQKVVNFEGHPTVGFPPLKYVYFTLCISLIIMAMINYFIESTGTQHKNLSAFDANDSSYLRILILPFKPRRNCTIVENDYEFILFNRLNSVFANANIKAKIFNDSSYIGYNFKNCIISSKEPLKLGKLNKADIIIFGDYDESCITDSVNITLNIGFISEFASAKSIEDLRKFNSIKLKESVSVKNSNMILSISNFRQLESFLITLLCKKVIENYQKLDQKYIDEILSDLAKIYPEMSFATEVGYELKMNKNDISLERAQFLFHKYNMNFNKLLDANKAILGILYSMENSKSIIKLVENGFLLPDLTGCAPWMNSDTFYCSFMINKIYEKNLQPESIYAIVDAINCSENLINVENKIIYLDNFVEFKVIKNEKISESEYMCYVNYRFIYSIYQNNSQSINKSLLLAKNLDYKRQKAFSNYYYHLLKIEHPKVSKQILKIFPTIDTLVSPNSLTIG